MAKSVYVPEAGGIIDFPDEATPQQMLSYIKGKYGAAKAAPAAPAASESDNSGILGRAAYGFARGITDVPGGIAALMYPAEEAAQTTAGQFSEGARKYLQETFGIDPTKDPTTAQQLAEAVGSVGSFLVPGTAALKAAKLAGAARAAGTAAAVMSGAQGVALGAGSRAETIQQQLASGMEISKEQQLAAQRLDGLIGATEALPINKFFGPIGKLLEKVPVSKAPEVERIVQSRLARLTRAGLEEGAQEAASGIASDLVERGVYNPNVEIGQDLLSNAGTGAFAGSFVEGLIQLAAGRKLRPARELARDISSQGAQDREAYRNATVAKAAENLRTSGAEGGLSVEQEDFDGITGYTIKDKAGQTFGQFDTETDATEAIGRYKAETGANVFVRGEAGGPQIFPVKIGAQKFDNLDAIRSARDELVAKRQDEMRFAQDPELLKAGAEKDGVSETFYAARVAKGVEKIDARIKRFDNFIKEAEPVAQPAAQPPSAEPAVRPAAVKAEVQTPIAEPAIQTPVTEQVAQEPAIEPVVEEPVTNAVVTSEPSQPEVVSQPEPTKALSVKPAQDGITATPIEAIPAITEAAPEGIATIPIGAVETPSGLTAEAPIAISQPTPQTFTEAASAGPKIREINPETKAKMQEVYARVRDNVKPIVPGEVDLRFQTLINNDPDFLVRGQVSTEAAPDGIKVIIDLSTGIFRPNATVEQMVKELTDRVNHEIIHVLRVQGVWRPAEWKMLSRAVANTKVPGKKYTYLDKAQTTYTPNGKPITPAYSDPEVVTEEAVAEMYRDWVNKNDSAATRQAKAPAGVAGLLNRAAEFFRRIFRALKNTSYESVFEDIQSGEMAKREAKPTEIAEPRLSAAPLPPNLAAKSKRLFAPTPDDSMFARMTEALRSEGPKTLNTIYGTVEMSKGQRMAIASRINMVDNTAFVEFIEKVKNEKEGRDFSRMVADFSATASLGWLRRSSQILASMIFRGKLEISFARPGDIQSATMKTVDDPDSLLKIFKIMGEPGPIDPDTGEQKDKREIWRLYAAAKRSIGLRADGKLTPGELDPASVSEIIQFTQTNYPEVVQAYEMYQRFNRNLLTAARDAEYISQRDFDNLTKRMDYYGFYREFHEEEIVPGVSSKAAGKIALRAYKGSERGGLIDDPMFVIIQNANFWVNAIAKNIAARKTFELAKDMGEARLLGASEKPDQDAGEAKEVMFLRENGEIKRFAVKDPMLVAALGADDRVDAGAMMKMLGAPTKWLRESITRDPVFMFRNLLRDTLSSWVTSGENITPVVGTLKGLKDALKGGSSFQALMGRGVVGSYDLAMLEPREIARQIRERNTPLNVHTITGPDALNKVIGAAWHRLGVWSEASDAATRIAVYESALRQGMSEAEASYRAIEIMDFSRRGASQLLSTLTKLVPFLNARIQGLDIVYQGMAASYRLATGKSQGQKDANLAKSFLVRGAILTAIAVALEMYNENEEEYRDLPSHIKTSNLLIPLSLIGIKGQYLAVSNPFEVGMLFNVFPRQIYKTMTDQASTRETANLFFSAFGSTFGVNPTPQFALPAFEVITGYDFYTKLPLIPEGKSRLAPELQYDQRTSSIAMILSEIPIVYNFTTGKFEGASPMVIDHLIGGYAGPMGSYISEAASVVMSDFLNVGPEKMPKQISELPGIRSVFIDAESRNPKTVGEAYELYRIIDEANRSFSRLRQIGDAEAVKDFLDENRDVLKYKKYVYKLVDGLNKLSARERQIQQDKEMTDDQKIEAMKQLREIRGRLTSKVAEINKALGR